MAYEDMLDDGEFWADAKASFLRIVRPLFKEAYIVGAALGAQEVPKRKELSDHIEGWDELLAGISGIPFDFEAINAAADEFIASYTNRWWDQIEASTKRQMRRIFLDAHEEGLSVAEVSKRLEPLFGKPRAQRIAVSELTDLMGGGAQETYRRAGFGQWEWRTVQDSRVDQICRDLSGARFAIDLPFVKAHFGCRCWPVPVGMATAGRANPQALSRGSIFGPVMG